MNIVGIWPDIDRAFEIAYVGNLNVNVYWHPDYIDGRDDFLITFRMYGHILNTDGQRWKHNEIGYYLNVELFTPGFDAVGTEIRRERLIELTKLKTYSQMPTEVSKTGMALLKTAYDKLHWGITRKDYCLKVAAAIAKLDGSQTIEAMHIAESVQYMRLPEYE